jgi:branched-subunit amino acid aminotransferase/4-amino-4-deoxychorismate lyase
MCDQKNNIIEGISSNIFFIKDKVVLIKFWSLV